MKDTAVCRIARPTQDPANALVVAQLIPATLMLAPFTIEILGLSAAMLTTLCWVPQAIRTIRTRDTRAISLITQCAFAAGVFLWLLYGLAIGSTPIILANAVTLVLVTTILALKLRYG